MKDMAKTLEKLLTDAEDCHLIGKLAGEPVKREAFKRLATQLQMAAAELKLTMAQSK